MVCFVSDKELLHYKSGQSCWMRMINYLSQCLFIVAPLLIVRLLS